MENEIRKALTFDQLVEYDQKVLLPAIDEIVNERTKNFVTKDEFNGFKDKTADNFDHVFKKLDILLEGEDIRL